MSDDPDLVLKMDYGPTKQLKARLVKIPYKLKTVVDEDFLEDVAYEEMRTRIQELEYELDCRHTDLLVYRVFIVLAVCAVLIWWTVKIVN